MNDTALTLIIGAAAITAGLIMAALAFYKGSRP